jgi:hypothetical protein
MPHSLRAKIKGLRYKGIITDKDCNRLCNTLDNESVLEKIRDEIEELQMYKGLYNIYIDRAHVLEIIDKYRAEILEER